MLNPIKPSKVSKEIVNQLSHHLATAEKVHHTVFLPRGNIFSNLEDFIFWTKVNTQRQSWRCSVFKSPVEVADINDAVEAARLLKTTVLNMEELEDISFI